jgi:hypothetical protein
LHPQKTRLVDATADGGFDFLGYHFERGYCWPRAKSLDKLKTAIRAKTRRTAGRSLRAIIGELNRLLRGWYGYFHCSGRNVFETLDAMVRRRLRRILLKRRGKRGKGMGWSHRRWPNAYFTRQGVVELHDGPCCEGSNSMRATDWRAGCGRTACPVRREGRGNSMSRPYPYQRASRRCVPARGFRLAAPSHTS